MVRVDSVFVGAAVFVLHGCGGGGGGDDPSGGGGLPSSSIQPPTQPATQTTTQSTTTTMTEACAAPHQRFGDKGCFYKCESDLQFPVVASSKKGMDLDDTTLHWCPDNMHWHWPNTNEPVTSFRMFKAWAGWWNEPYAAQKEVAWQSLARYLKASQGTVLVGTQISCNETEDDADWENVKAMVKIFGPEQIMGLAIGNELELLWTKHDVIGDTLPECLDRIWHQEYFLKKFHARVKEFDSLGDGFKNVKVTSVFGGFILATPGYPFYDRGDDNIARVLPFLQNVTKEYGERYAHTLNIYPFFEPKATYDDDAEPPTCDKALRLAKCFEGADGSESDDVHFGDKDCIFIWMLRRMRERLDALGNASSTLWIGETGWSSPKPETLSTKMAWCSDWSTTQSFAEYYANFLNWDMNMPGTKYKGPDHVFYFSMRDSSNFGLTEGFGLVGDGDSAQWCSNTTCKLQQSSWAGFPSTTTTTLVTTTMTGQSPAIEIETAATLDEVAV